jgi:hypothetical protein
MGDSIFAGTNCTTDAVKQFVNMETMYPDNWNSDNWNSDIYNVQLV